MANRGRKTPSVILRRKVYARDGWRCKKCRYHSPDGRYFELHHIVEFSDGGSDEPDNLDTLCAMCHAEWTWIWQGRYSELPYDEWLTIAPMYSTFQVLLATLYGLNLGIPRDLVERLLLGPRKTKMGLEAGAGVP